MSKLDDKPSLLDKYIVQRNLPSEHVAWTKQLAHHKSDLVIIDSLQLNQADNDLIKAFEQALISSEELSISGINYYLNHYQSNTHIYAIRKYINRVDFQTLIKDSQNKIKLLYNIINSIILFLNEVANQKYCIVGVSLSDLSYNPESKKILIDDLRPFIKIGEPVEYKSFFKCIAPELIIDSNLTTHAVSAYALGILIKKIIHLCKFHNDDMTPLHILIKRLLNVDPNNRLTDLDIISMKVEACLCAKPSKQTDHALNYLLNQLRLTPDLMFDNYSNQSQITEYLDRKNISTFLLITGSSGFGKSTLVEHALQKYHQEDTTVLSIKFNATTTSFANDIMQGFIGWQQNSKFEHAKYLKFCDSMGGYDNHFIVWFNEFTGSMPNQNPNQITEELSGGSLSNKKLQQCLEDLILLNPPQTVILDDIQWIHEDSVIFISELIKCCRKQHIPVIIMSRDIILFNKTFSNLLKDINYTQLPLTGLTTTKIINHISITSHDLDKAIQRLINMTEGSYWTLRWLLKNMTNGVNDFQSFISMQSQRYNQIIQHAALIGLKFDCRVLQKIFSKNSVHKLISNLIHAQILSKHGEYEYKFTHDKPRDLIIDSLSTEDKQRIIYHLLANYSTSPKHNATKSQLFLMLNDSSLITKEIERYLSNYAWQNFNKMAYQAALIAYQRLQALPLKHYEYKIKYLSCLYKSKQYKKAVENCIAILPMVENLIEKTRILEIIVDSYMALGQLDKGVDYAIQALKCLGVRIKLYPTPFINRLNILYLIRKCKKISRISFKKITTKKPNQLVKLKSKLLVSIIPVAYNLGNKPLLENTIILLAKLTFKFGETNETSYLLAILGMLFCQHKQYQLGYHFGTMAINYIQKYKSPAYGAAVYYIFAMFIQPWKQHSSIVTDNFSKAIQCGIEMNEDFYTAYSCYGSIAWNQCMSLPLALKKFNSLISICQKTGICQAIDRIIIYRNFISFFAQEDNDSDELNGYGLCEQDHLSDCIQKNYSTSIGVYYLLKAKQFLLTCNYSQAYVAIIKLIPYEAQFYGLFREIEYGLYKCLIMVDSKLYLKEHVARTILKNTLLKFIKRLNKLMNFSSTNFSHLYYLLRAEHQFIFGKRILAQAYYLQALEAAQTNNYPLDQAMILTRLTQFYKHGDQPHLALNFAQQCYELYKLYGYHYMLNILQRMHGKFFAAKLDHDTFLSKQLGYLSQLQTRLLSASDEDSIYTLIAGDLGNLCSATELLIATKQTYETTALSFYFDRGSGKIKAAISPINGLFIQYCDSIMSSCQNVNFNLEADISALSINGKHPKSYFFYPILLDGEVSHVIYIQNTLMSGLYQEHYITHIKPILDTYWSIVNNHFINQQKQASLRKIKENALEIAHLSKFNLAGELLGCLSHEINQPLMAIMAYLTSVKHSLQARNMDQELLRIIDNSIDLANYSGTIITHYRSYIKQQDIHFCQADITQIINDAILILDYKLRQNNIILNLPSSEQSYMINCDKIQVQQIFINLISNSIDAFTHYPAHDKIIDISIQWQHKTSILIIYRDSGPGIPLLIQQHLFSPLISKKSSGMGMGLCIVKKIIETHAASIEYSGSSNKGACFIINFPARSIPDDEK